MSQPVRSTQTQRVIARDRAQRTLRIVKVAAATGGLAAAGGATYLAAAAPPPHHTVRVADTGAKTAAPATAPARRDRSKHGGSDRHRREATGTRSPAAAAKRSPAAPAPAAAQTQIPVTSAPPTVAAQTVSGGS